MASKDTELAACSKTIGEKEDRTYTEKRSVRVIISNEKGEIILMFPLLADSCRLPGATIGDEEYHVDTVKRAAIEETGYSVEPGSCLATTEEWRDGVHLICFCYKAELLEGVARKDRQQYRNGFLTDMPEWLRVEEALQRMTNSKAVTELVKFIRERDLFFIETYITELGAERAAEIRLKAEMDVN